MTTTSRPAEEGYILAQSILLLIPMLVFAAFATDIGYWYLEGQKAQRAADAAALAAVSRLPDMGAAETEARLVAARNGYTDTTPGDNGDFSTGSTPQVQVLRAGPDSIEVKVRREVGSILGRMVLDSIDLERFAIAEYVRPLSLGNPTSALGTGTIPESQLGVPADTTWLALSAYCTDIEHGDHISAGYSSGITVLSYEDCGPTAHFIEPGMIPNPKHNPDGFTFVVETQPGSGPIDLSIFHPGGGCTESIGGVSLPDPFSNRPRIYYRVYGPNTRFNHQEFIDSNTPITEGLPPTDSCIANSPDGDGWYPIALGLTAPADGGHYYIRTSVRNPHTVDLDPADTYWDERGMNAFSLKATPAGSSLACAYSSANPTCPQLYALDWLPLWRRLAATTTKSFYIAEISEQHAGSQVTIHAFDVADGSDNLQLEDPHGNASPFRYRYADTLINGFSGTGYFNTSLDWATDTCSWGAVPSNPCLITDPYADFNNHSIELVFDIPADYTCGADCWWKVRYATSSASDRTNWTIFSTADPIRLVE